MAHGHAARQRPRLHALVPVDLLERAVLERRAPNLRPPVVVRVQDVHHSLVVRLGRRLDRRERPVRLPQVRIAAVLVEALGRHAGLPGGGVSGRGRRLRRYWWTVVFLWRLRLLLSGLLVLEWRLFLEELAQLGVEFGQRIGRAAAGAAAAAAGAAATALAKEAVEPAHWGTRVLRKPSRHGWEKYGGGRVAGKKQPLKLFCWRRRFASVDSKGAT